MASYTDNYALTKPTMAESADIRVINSNMDTVDDVMHSTQISLAPAYDMHETYNTGDVVMYELLMYECLEDEVTGAWDATKWQRTTAGEHGGGSDVTVTQIQTEGKAVASIAVDGVSTNILIPELKVYGEATGDLITIEDAMEAPLEECKVTLEPQQDLNGYDNPWPAGGGKNLFDNTANPNKWIYSDGALSDDNGSITSQLIETSEGQTYTLSNGSTTATLCICFYDENMTLLDRTAKAGTAKITVTAPANSKYMYASSFKQSQTPQLELGSTATTYEPYSNICPISGWSAVNRYRTGINVWDEEWEVGSISDASGQDATNSNYRRSKSYISVKANKKYYFNVPSKYGTTYRFYQYKQNKDYIGIKMVDSDGTFETDNDCAFIRFRIATTEDYTNDISINYPSTDTSYHAYNGHTTTIDLNGTRYGGKVDVVNGTMTVDRASVDMGDLYWNYGSSSKVFTASVSGIKSGTYTDENLISSIYPVTPLPYSQFEYGLRYDSPTSIGVKNPLYTDATAFKTAMSGVQLVYELATPTEIQLTPTEVTLLRGINNIWSDGEMYIKYRRDIEMLLQRIADSLGGNA